MPNTASACPLTLEVERTASGATVRCRGKLIFGVGDVLYSTVSRLFPDCKCIVLDLTGLTHMDSMGLGTLVRLYVSARSAGCQLRLVNVGKRIQELLGITHLLSVLTDAGEHGCMPRF